MQSHLKNNHIWTDKLKHNNKEITDMTAKDAKEFFGQVLWKKMLDTQLLDGITCSINKNKELIIYGCDLENAYNKILTGKELFFD